VSLHLAENASIANQRVQEEDDLYYFKLIIPHAINLAYLIKFGAPKVGEPLTESWKRTGDEGSDDPFNISGAESISFHLLAHAFPRAEDRLKAEINAVFETAPAWLLWFSEGDCTAELLGLNVPNDMFSMVQYARSITVRLPGLPRDAFTYQLRQPGSKPITPTEAWHLRKAELMSMPMSRRQMKRAQISNAEPPPPAEPPLRWPEILPLSPYP
jgi:hypothetical protein